MNENWEEEDTSLNVSRGAETEIAAVELKGELGIRTSICSYIMK